MSNWTHIDVTKKCHQSIPANVHHISPHQKEDSPVASVERVSTIIYDCFSSASWREQAHVHSYTGSHLVATASCDPAAASRVLWKTSCKSLLRLSGELCFLTRRERHCRHCCATRLAVSCQITMCNASENPSVLRSVSKESIRHDTYLQFHCILVPPLWIVPVQRESMTRSQDPVVQCLCILDLSQVKLVPCSFGCHRGLPYKETVNRVPRSVQQELFLAC